MVLRHLNPFSPTISRYALISSCRIANTLFSLRIAITIKKMKTTTRVIRDRSMLPINICCDEKIFFFFFYFFFPPKICCQLNNESCTIQTPSNHTIKQFLKYLRCRCFAHNNTQFGKMSIYQCETNLWYQKA